MPFPDSTIPSIYSDNEITLAISELPIEAQRNLYMECADILLTVKWCGEQSWADLKDVRDDAEYNVKEIMIPLRNEPELTCYDYPDSVLYCSWIVGMVQVSQSKQTIFSSPETEEWSSLESQRIDDMRTSDHWLASRLPLPIR